MIISPRWLLRWRRPYRVHQPEKTISFLLPINGGEAASLIVAVAASGWRLPITRCRVSGSTGQLPWCGDGLAFEPAVQRSMQKAPRRSVRPADAFLVLAYRDCGSLLFLGGIFASFQWAMHAGLRRGCGAAPGWQYHGGDGSVLSVLVSTWTALHYMRGVLGTPAVMIVIGLIHAAAGRSPIAALFAVFV